jgi:hypothetical protein
VRFGLLLLEFRKWLVDGGQAYALCWMIGGLIFALWKGIDMDFAHVGVAVEVSRVFCCSTKPV